MPTIQVSTKAELNKAVYELAVLIQNLAKEGTPHSVAQLTGIVQSAAALVNSVIPFNLLD